MQAEQEAVLCAAEGNLGCDGRVLRVTPRRSPRGKFVLALTEEAGLEFRSWCAGCQVIHQRPGDGFAVPMSTWHLFLFSHGRIPCPCINPQYLRWHLRSPPAVVAPLAHTPLMEKGGKRRKPGRNLSRNQGQCISIHWAGHKNHSGN